MAAIGAGWIDGAWTEAGWVTSGDGAWEQDAADPAVFPDGALLRRRSGGVARYLKLAVFIFLTLGVM